MVLTAAVGGLDPARPRGTVVVVRDHLNMMGGRRCAGGATPTARRPSSRADIYDDALRELALERAQALGIASPSGSTRR